MLPYWAFFVLLAYFIKGLTIKIEKKLAEELFEEVVPITFQSKKLFLVDRYFIYCYSKIRKIGEPYFQIRSVYL